MAGGKASWSARCLGLELLLSAHLGRPGATASSLEADAAIWVSSAPGGWFRSSGFRSQPKVCGAGERVGRNAKRQIEAIGGRPDAAPVDGYMLQKLECHGRDSICACCRMGICPARTNIVSGQNQCNRSAAGMHIIRTRPPPKRTIGLSVWQLHRAHNVADAR